MFKHAILSAMLAGAVAVSGLSAANAAPVPGPDFAPVLAEAMNPVLVGSSVTGYYNGHRGWRQHRSGYTYHNGYWYPPAAFALGIILGHGAVVVERKRHYRRSHGLSGQHYAWCEGRYKTYRSWDNTYVPRKGYRAECHSPYWP